MTVTARVLTLLGLLIAAWVVMTVTHELGHLIGGWLGGASLQQFYLAPWRVPYSVHHPDPHPLVSLWMGPLVGVLAPFVAALILRRSWAFFIADFCLLANGTYLAIAWIAGSPQLDTQRLLAAGASPVLVAMYCVATIAFGYVRFRRDCIFYLTLPSKASDSPDSPPRQQD